MPWGRRVRRLVSSAGGRPVVVGPASICGQTEAPSFSQLVGIDQALAGADVATEVERGQRGPIRSIAQEDLGNVPERVARLHRVAGAQRARRRHVRCSTAGKWRADGRTRSVAGRRVGAGAGRQPNGCAEGRQGQHTERDPGGQAVDDRRIPARPDLAVAYVRHDSAQQLRAAGAPCHPGRQDEEVERRVRDRPPAVPETSRQGISDDHDQRGRDCGEGEEGGAGGADDVEDPPRPLAPGRASHRPDRWRSCRSAWSSPRRARSPLPGSSRWHRAVTRPWRPSHPHSRPRSDS